MIVDFRAGTILQRSAFAVLLAASTLLPAQGGKGANGSYRIAGHVVNASTGEPVRRATVSVLDDQNNRMVATVETGPDGAFVMTGFPAGKFPLSASKRGFRTSFYDEHEGYYSAIVTGPDQDTAHLVFRLAPGAVLRGIVTADGGDAVEGAEVMLFRRELSATQGKHIIRFDGAMTDDTGAYEFNGLPPGEYLVAVRAEPWYAIHSRAGANSVSDPSPLDVAYPTTFFDSTTDETSAAPIALTSGSREEADITLHAVPALHLQVSGGRNAGNAAAQPELRQMIFGVRMSAANMQMAVPLPGPSGTVDFAGIAPGHYELVQGDPARIVDLDASSSREVDPTAGTPATTVTGTLRNSDGSPVPPGLMVVLDPLEDGPGMVQQQSPGIRGQFRFERVAPGPWALSAQDESGRPLTVTSIAGGGGVGNQLSVKDRPLSVVGTVSGGQTRLQGVARKDGKPAPGVMVVLAPRNPALYRALVRRDQSDTDGSFSLRDVPAGQYIAVAIEDGWNLDWTRYDVIARYLPGGVPVTVTERSGTVISLAGPVPVSTR